MGQGYILSKWPTTWSMPCSPSGRSSSAATAAQASAQLGPVAYCSTTSMDTEPGFNSSTASRNSRCPTSSSGCMAVLTVGA